jgi:hypothetical protein
MKEKKLLRRFICTFVAIALMVSVLSVIPSVSPITTVQAASKVKLTYKEIKLREGASWTLNLENAESSKVKWSSDDKKIVSVNAKGKIKAKKAGTATITATYKAKKYNCAVTVVAAPDIEVEVLTGGGDISSVKIKVKNNSSGKITVDKEGIVIDATVNLSFGPYLKQTLSRGYFYADSKTKITKGSSKTITYYKNENITSTETDGSSYFYFTIIYKGVEFNYEYYFASGSLILDEDSFPFLK